MEHPRDPRIDHSAPQHSPEKEEFYSIASMQEKNLETEKRTDKVHARDIKIAKKHRRLRNGFYFILDVVLNLSIILALVFFIRTYVISPFEVSGSSMCDTLNFIDGKCQSGTGEYIIVNKIGYLRLGNFQFGEPRRGQIVVFRPPGNEEDFFIKRIIGLPGETVIFENGGVKIENEENPEGFVLDESYLNERNNGHTNPDPFSGKMFEVPEDNYFVMGDNRRHSNDSRHCFSQGGCREGKTNFLPREAIEGRAWVVLWPIWLARFI